MKKHDGSQQRDNDLLNELATFGKHFVMASAAQAKGRHGTGLEDPLLLLQTIIDAIPIPIFYKNINGIYLGCNFAFQKYMGVSRKNIVGKTVYDVWPRNFAAIYDEKDRELFRTTGTQSYESRMSDSAGQVREVVFYKETFADLSGKVMGLVGAIFDITERKRLEEKLKESRDELNIRVKVRTAELSKANEELREEVANRRRIEAQLRREKDILKSYLDIASSVVVVIDISEQVVVINKKGCQLLGYPEKEIVGKNWFDHFVSGKERERVRKEFAQIRTGERGSYEYSEYPVLASDGKERLMGWRRAYVKDEHGEVSSVISSGDQIAQRVCDKRSNRARENRR